MQFNTKIIHLLKGLPISCLGMRNSCMSGKHSLSNTSVAFFKSLGLSVLVLDLQEKYRTIIDVQTRI